MSKLYFVFFFFYIAASALAQTNKNLPDELNTYFELISELSQRNDEETDYNDMADELYDLWQSPIDINMAVREDISRLFWLSEFQINSLTGYILHHKPIVSLYELTYIPGFDSSFVKSIRPFIKLTSVTNNNLLASGRCKQMVLMRFGRVIENQSGYNNEKLEGSPWKINLRYKMEQGEKLSMGLNLEKDPGETLFKGSNRAGPDFYSGYLKVNNIGKIKSLCIGDYSLGFGQGLVLGQGFALGKSAQSVNLIQKEMGIRPYTSTDENRYFRGIATTVTYKTFDLTIFFSHKHIDAHIAAIDSSGNVTVVSSLQTSGYHATVSERADENSLKELTTGFRIAHNSNKFRTGLSLIHTQFDASIYPIPTDYNQFYFSGKRQTNLGYDYKILLRNIILFGEEAVDMNANKAFVNGVTANLYNRLQFLLLHRYYSKGYQAFYGNGFGENAHIQNEEGVYGGFRFPLVKHIYMGMYVDMFRFPWLKYQVDAPSYGRELMVQAEFSKGEGFSGYIQYRTKQKQMNRISSDSMYHCIGQSDNDRLRFHIHYKLNEHLILNMRLETGWLINQNLPDEKGYLIYEDIQWRSYKYPMDIYFRYAIFDTDTYNSRIYAYENDVLYAFNSNVYYKEGQRFYLLLKLEPLKKLNFWIKYSRTIYPHEQTISSGDFQINGNTRSDIRLQVIYNF